MSIFKKYGTNVDQPSHGCLLKLASQGRKLLNREATWRLRVLWKNCRGPKLKWINVCTEQLLHWHEQNFSFICHIWCYRLYTICSLVLIFLCDYPDQLFILRLVISSHFYQDPFIIYLSGPELWSSELTAKQVLNVSLFWYTCFKNFYCRGIGQQTTSQNKWFCGPWGPELGTSAFPSMPFLKCSSVAGVLLFLHVSLLCQLSLLLSGSKCWND